MNWGMCYWCKRDVKQEGVPDHVENGDPIHKGCNNEYRFSNLSFSQDDIRKLKILLKMMDD